MTEKGVDDKNNDDNIDEHQDIFEKHGDNDNKDYDNNNKVTQNLFLE